MALIPIAPEQYNRVQAELQEMMAEAGEPKLKNAQATRTFVASGTFFFRGRQYLVPPVSYSVGRDLQVCAQTMHELQGKPATAENIEAAHEVMDELAGIFYRASRPVSRWRRLLRPLMPNPFRAMTETEAGTLHGFFCACRTRSSVRYSSGSTESAGTSTSSTRSPRSRGRTRSG